MGSTAGLSTGADLTPATTGDVLREHLTAQLRQMERLDPLVREDAPDSVHKMRVCARRTRSALSTYRPVLEPGSAGHLVGELRWLGGVLAEARDAQVMRARLDALVGQQPEELVVGPAVGVIDAELDGRYQSGRAAADAALGGARYARILTDLRSFTNRPPFTDAAAQPARRALPILLQRDWKRVRDRDRLVGDATAPDDRDRAMHDVRKAAKQLRYAAESAVPVLGPRAGRIATTAKRLQDALGEHQDTVVARETLLAIAARGGVDVMTGFVLGRLHAAEEARATAIEDGYRDLLAAFPATNLEQWLRR
jgi:CHAD domain-containing protein